MQTRYFGNDCLGNTPHAITVEGTCIADIYEPEATRYYNQATGQRGTVARGEDGQLHFAAAKGFPPPSEKRLSQMRCHHASGWTRAGYCYDCGAHENDSGV